MYNDTEITNARKKIAKKNKQQLQQTSRVSVQVKICKQQMYISSYFFKKKNEKKKLNATYSGSKCQSGNSDVAATH